MKTNKLVLLLCIATLFSIVSCNEDNPKSNDSNSKGTFIIGVSSEKKAYAITAESLESGAVSIANNGQKISDEEIINYSDEKAFTFEYRKGDPSVYQSIKFDASGNIVRSEEKSLTQRKDFSEAFPPHLVAVNSGVEDKATGKLSAVFMFIDGITEELQPDFLMVTEDVLHKGEYFNFCGILPLGNDEFMSAAETYKNGGKNEKGKTLSLDSDYPDEMTLFFMKKEGNKAIIKKTITSDKAAPAVGRRRSGRMNCLVKDSKGDIYAFSPSSQRSKGEKPNYEYYKPSKYPSAVLKVNKSSQDFDANYYVNLEELSGGYKLQNVFALYDDYALLNFYSDKDKFYNMAGAFKYAIFNLVTKDFKWIEGLPDPKKVGAYDPRPFVVKAEKKVYLPLSAEGFGNFIYTIDVAKATAQKGLEIKGDVSLGNVVKLTVPEK